jgi:hypothetical protein
VKFEAADFPAITVCNLNPYKLSLMNQVDDLAKMVRTTHVDIAEIKSFVSVTLLQIHIGCGTE